MSKHKCDIAVIFFCGTTGINKPELLGSDEKDLVIIVWQIINLTLNQTGDIHYIYVRPNTTDILESEWQNDTGITEEALKNAPTLEDAIFQFEQTLRNELNIESTTCSFTLCTDGQCHLRQVFLPAAAKQNLLLPDFCYSFFDLKKEFQCCFSELDFKNHNHVDERMAMMSNESFALSAQISVDEMMSYLNVTVEEYGRFGVDHVRRMSAVVQVMISDQYGHKFNFPETIFNHLDSGPCMLTDVVDDDTVVRARGLPWQASDHDVAKFFKGLNIPRGGAALVLNMQGRRNGEALVRFENSEQRNLALLRHKHHMGNRYIEVYRASGEEFLRVATGTSTEALNFLSKKGVSIVRMRGLPFSATATEIVNFFGEKIPVCEKEDGVLFVKHGDGRPTGDAFVLFPNEEVALEALSKHKDTLGKRYVEIFKSTAAEVQQVLSRYSAVPLLSAVSQTPPMFVPQIMPVQPALVPHQAPILPLIQPTIPPGAIRNCVRLRGMPYSASAEDVITFLGELSFYIIPGGIHFVLNQQGRPSGDAFVQLVSAEKAAAAGSDVSKGGCHKKHMGERYVEVFQCSGDEMNIVLLGGSLNRNGTLPPPGMALIPPEYPMPAIIQNTAQIPHQTVATSPYLVQSPQGTLVINPPLTVQGTGFAGYHRIDINQYPAIIAASRTPVHSQHAYFSCASYLPTPPVSPTSQGNLLPPIVPSSSPRGSIIAINESPEVHLRLQGMACDVTVSDVANFLKKYNIETDTIRLIYDDKFRPTGDAIVSFSSFEEAHRAVMGANGKLMNGHCVEIFVCGFSE